eukprot:g589.t1
MFHVMLFLFSITAVSGKRLREKRDFLQADTPKWIVPNYAVQSANIKPAVDEEGVVLQTQTGEKIRVNSLYLNDGKQNDAATYKTQQDVAAFSVSVTDMNTMDTLLSLKGIQLTLLEQLSANVKNHPNTPKKRNCELISYFSKVPKAWDLIFRHFQDDPQESPNLSLLLFIAENNVQVVNLETSEDSNQDVKIELERVQGGLKLLEQVEQYKEENRGRVLLVNKYTYVDPTLPFKYFKQLLLPGHLPIFFRFCHLLAMCKFCDEFRSVDVDGFDPMHDELRPSSGGGPLAAFMKGGSRTGSATAGPLSAFMPGNTNAGGRCPVAEKKRRKHLSSVRGWAEDAVEYYYEERYPDAYVSVAEVECMEEDCPPLEVIFTILDKKDPAMFRVPKPLMETTEDDVKNACMYLVRTGRNRHRAKGKEREKTDNCPKKHGLTKHVTERAGYGCDWCGKAQKSGVILMGCRVCDFDLCNQCYKEETKVDGNKPPTPPPASQTQTNVTKVSSKAAKEARIREIEAELAKLKAEG